MKNSRKTSQNTPDYNQRIQNYKQDIEQMKSQVSHIEKQIDFDWSSDSNNDNFENVSSNYKRSSSKKNKNQFQDRNIENDDYKKFDLNASPTNLQYQRKSPNKSTSHKSKQSIDRKINVEIPSIENYNIILTDNKVLAHKMKVLISSNSNLDMENKSLKESNNTLNKQNQNLNEKLNKAKARIIKLSKELKSKNSSEQPTKNQPQSANSKSNSNSTRSKSVTKIPVMIDPDQIKEKVNSRDTRADQLLSLDSSLEKASNEELNQSNESLQKGKLFQSKIDQLTIENTKLKKKLKKLSKPSDESSSIKKLRDADSQTIAELTEKIALLEEENRKYREKALSEINADIENQDLKKQLNSRQRSRPIDNEAIANLTEKISELTQENMSLKKSLISSRSLRNENEELKEKLKNSDNNSNADPSEKVALLTKENNELKSAAIANRSLEREYAKLQNKYNSLIEAIQRANPDQAAKKQIEKLKATIKALSKENSDLKSNSSSEIQQQTSEGSENASESNEIKKLNEQLNASRMAINQMEKDFDLQKKELKDNYDSLLKEIINDLHSDSNQKEVQLIHKVKTLEQQLNNQMDINKSLHNANKKLQEQISQTRSNNLQLIKEIEELNKKNEQSSPSSIKSNFNDDLSKSLNQSIDDDATNIDGYEQAEKEFGQNPDSFDSGSIKEKKVYYKLNQDQNQQSNSNSPSINNQKDRNSYQELNSNDDSNNLFDDNDENDDDILGESDDIDKFINENKKYDTDEEEEKINTESNQTDKNNPIRLKVENTSAEFDAFLDDQSLNTNEEFRKFVDSIKQNKSELSMNTEEEFEKIKLSLLDDISPESNKNSRKRLSNDYLLDDEDLDDKNFSS